MWPTTNSPRRQPASFRPNVEALEDRLALSQLVPGERSSLFFTVNRHVYTYTDGGDYVDTQSPLARSNDSGLSVYVPIGGGGGYISPAYLLGADNLVWRYSGSSWESVTTPAYGPQNVKSIVAGNREAFALDGANQLWIYNEYQASLGGHLLPSGWKRTEANGHDMTLGTDRRGSDEVWLLGWRDNGYGKDVWRYDHGRASFTGGYLTQLQAGHQEAFGFTRGGALWQAFDPSGSGLLHWTNTGLRDGRSSGHEFSVASQGNYRWFDTAWFKDQAGHLWEIRELSQPDGSASVFDKYDYGPTALSQIQAGYDDFAVFGVKAGTGHIYLYGTSPAEADSPGFYASKPRYVDTGLSAGTPFVVGQPHAAPGADAVWTVNLEGHWGGLGFGYFQPELVYSADGVAHRTGIAIV